jgi:hypothetical protein
MLCSGLVLHDICDYLLIIYEQNDQVQLLMKSMIAKQSHMINITSFNKNTKGLEHSMFTIKPCTISLML